MSYCECNFLYAVFGMSDVLMFDFKGSLTGSAGRHDGRKQGGKFCKKEGVLYIYHEHIELTILGN